MTEYLFDIVHIMHTSYENRFCFSNLYGVICLILSSRDAPIILCLSLNVPFLPFAKASAEKHLVWVQVCSFFFFCNYNSGYRGYILHLHI